MNVQVNPALYPAQHAYGYSNPLPRAQSVQQPFPNQQAHSSPPPPSFPNYPQGPPQQQAPQQFYQQYQQQNAAFARPQSRENNDLARAPQASQNSGTYTQPGLSASRSEAVSQTPAAAIVTASQLSNVTNTPALAPSMTPSNMIQRQALQTPGLAQQAQMQNAASQQRLAQQPTPSLSPQSAGRERARVTVLLEINTHLLQEVVSLQAQGKAGMAPTQPQPSPTSPTSAADPVTQSPSSPLDASKQGSAKPPSQEYADCMRRLQANLSYLAAIADAKKKVNGSLPVGPAIMIPPPHLGVVQELYKKLNALFPEASQSTINKAMAMAQASKGPALGQAQG